MTEAALVSVVLPVYEEAEGLETTVRAVIAALGDRPRELLLVDDGSKDRSWEVILGLSAADPTIRGLRFSRNFGHQSALLAGLTAARGAAVITLDSDGQHPPELIPELLARWRAGARVVQALRATGDEGLFKRLASRAFYRVFTWLAGTAVAPGSADYRLLDRAAVDVLLAAPRMAMFLRGFVPWTGIAMDAVPYAPRARTTGRTKYSLRRMLRLAEEGILRFSVAPLRCSLLLGLITSGFSLAYLAYVFVMRLLDVQGVVPGWASVAGLVALLGGIQLLVLGVMGEYLGTIFGAVMARPDWIVIERANPAEARGGATP